MKKALFGTMKLGVVLLAAGSAWFSISGNDAEADHFRTATCFVGVLYLVSKETA